MASRAVMAAAAARVVRRWSSKGNSSKVGAAGPGKTPEAAAKRAMLPPPTVAGRRCSGGATGRGVGRRGGGIGDESGAPGCCGPCSAGPRRPSHPPLARTGAGGPARRSTTPLAPRWAADSGACREGAVAMERERDDRRRQRWPMPTPQRVPHGAAATGRVGWSSQGAAVAGGTRGPCPPPRSAARTAPRAPAVRAPGRRRPVGCPRGRALRLSRRTRRRRTAPAPLPTGRARARPPACRPGRAAPARRRR